MYFYIVHTIKSVASGVGSSPVVRKNDNGNNNKRCDYPGGRRETPCGYYTWNGDHGPRYTLPSAQRPYILTNGFVTVAGVAHLVDNGRVVLVPQPNNSPNDPLNWNRRWKFVIMAQMILLSFSQSMGPLSISPQVPFYIEEWHKDLASVLRFVSS
jgi:hypothetical protein